VFGAKSDKGTEIMGGMHIPRWILVLIVSCAFAISTFAGLTGDILGTVLDTSTAAVAGATVTVKNANTGTLRVVSTNEYGEYSVPHST
jgi:Carboxypeptidase regulatory-like domain